MKVFFLLLLIAVIGCGEGEGGGSTVSSIIAGDNSVIVSDNNGNTSVEVVAAEDSSEASGQVGDAIEECCPFFIGLADDDCIIQNYPGLPDDLCRGEPNEDGSPTPRPLGSVPLLRAGIGDDGKVYGYWEMK